VVKNKWSYTATPLRAQGQIYITVSGVIHLDSINVVGYERLGTEFEKSIG